MDRDRVVHPRSPKVPEKCSLCVLKVTVETNTDGLSPAQDAWSQPDISLHALATLKNARDGFHGSQARIIELMKKDSSRRGSPRSPELPRNTRSVCSRCLARRTQTTSRRQRTPGRDQISHFARWQRSRTPVTGFMIPTGVLTVTCGSKLGELDLGDGWLPSSETGGCRLCQVVGSWSSISETGGCRLRRRVVAVSAQWLGVGQVSRRRVVAVFGDKWLPSLPSGWKLVRYLGGG